MAGLTEVCNHVGAVLYKTMHEISTLAEISCTSLSNKWLPATIKKKLSLHPNLVTMTSSFLK